MTANGVEVRPVFFPMHRMPPYLPFVRPGQLFSVSDELSDWGISLPSAVTMDDGDIDRVCGVLTHVLAQYRLEVGAVIESVVVVEHTTVSTHTNATQRPILQGHTHTANTPGRASKQH